MPIVQTEKERRVTCLRLFIASRQPASTGWGWGGGHLKPLGSAAACWQELYMHHSAWIFLAPFLFPSTLNGLIRKRKTRSI